MTAWSRTCRVTGFSTSSRTRAALRSPCCASLAEQLQATNLRLLARNSESAGWRTGHKLAELAALRKRHHRDDGASTSVVLDITQSDLAGWVGTSRESVCRALGDFRRHGVVDTGRGHITVYDIDELFGVSETL